MSLPEAAASSGRGGAGDTEAYVATHVEKQTHIHRHAGLLIACGQRQWDWTWVSA